MNLGKELIRRWIAFANAGFDGEFCEFVAPDQVGHLGGATMGRSELERLDRAFRCAFPDIAESWSEVDFPRLTRQLRSPLG